MMTATGRTAWEIKRVYSIWICMNMPKNSMTHYHLTKEQLVGNYEWKGDLDLLNIVMTGLSNKLPENNKYYELHRLLGALLSGKTAVEIETMLAGKQQI